MGKLIYVAITSLDGFMSDLSDRASDSTWSVPTADVFSAILQIQRPAGTYLYGRRMYETMAVWDTAHVNVDAPAFTPGLKELESEFATLWRAAEKVVFSTTLMNASTPRTRIERAIDPDRIRQLKVSGEHDITVGGPHLAAVMLAANLVDELHVFVHPIVTGRGIPWLPQQRMQLALVTERRLGAVTHLHYRHISPAALAAYAPT